MQPDVPSLQRRVDELFWYHTIELPGGVTTPGHASTPTVSPLPERLDGRTVLDIGAWDGKYSFEAIARGAASVLSIDHYTWTSDQFSKNQGYLLAREALGLEDRVQDQCIDLMDVSPEALGGRTFDVVLLLGVLYHLTDPIVALENAASVCTDLLVVETETALNWLSYPAARLYPNSDLADDDTNWYSYNVHALEALLRRNGFTKVEVKSRTSFPRRLVRAARAKQKGGSFRRQLMSARVVLHARR